MAAADALVFEATATRDLYAGWGRPGHSIVIPYGVHTRAILDYALQGSRGDAKSKAGVRPESRLVLVMGTIEPRKAQTRIAQAFASVAADHPEWSLVFVGDTNSHYSEVLKQYVGTLGLEDRCTVVPVDGDAYRWYGAADVLLSASDVESVPRSMLEAMCFGITVVSASVFGVPELVSNGETGFLFEPNDLIALESTLHRVLGLDDDELARVGEAGRQYVLEHHDSSGYTGELLRLCHGLLQSPGASPHDVLSKKQGVEVEALGFEPAR
jgi:glycosyltransferase involved in cell wall biosynthesis